MRTFLALLGVVGIIVGAIILSKFPKQQPAGIACVVVGVVLLIGAALSMKKRRRTLQRRRTPLHEETHEEAFPGATPEPAWRERAMSGHYEDSPQAAAARVERRNELEQKRDGDGLSPMEEDELALWESYREYDEKLLRL